MIATFLALMLQAAPPATALGPIGRQALPPKGCAAYLWSATDRQLVAMATAGTGTIRLSIGGRTVDLAKTGEQGAGDLGFAASTDYRGGAVTAMLTMQVVRQEGLSAGAQVPTGTLRVEQAGQDTLVVPVAGLVGCTAG